MPRVEIEVLKRINNSMLNKSMEKCTYPKRCHCEECHEADQIQQEFNYFLGERD